MDEIKKINRWFLIYLFSFVGCVIAFISIAVISYLLIENEDITYLIWFVSMALLLIVSGMFRNKMGEITNYSYILKIRENASEPIKLNPNSYNLEKALRSAGYQKKINNKAYHLYYRVVKDNIKRIFKRYMLEVVVISRIGKFFIDEVNNDIDALHAELHKQRKKTDKLFVTQIREVSELTDEVKEQIKEIAFVRSARGIISIINIGIHLPTKTAVMLYTDKYRPSLYYEYHVNQIKAILK